MDNIQINNSSGIYILEVTYIVRCPDKVDQSGISGIQLQGRNVNWCPVYSTVSTTHVNVISTDEPQTEDDLEDDSKADRKQPGKQPTTSNDLHPVVDEVAGQDDNQEVNDEDHTEHDHRSPDVGFEEWRV